MQWTEGFMNKKGLTKLLWRNKRSKSTVWLLALGLLYGLFFYPQPTYQNMLWFFVFIGIFSTGIFLINYGHFIPAWDSGYYKLLMNNNYCQRSLAAVSVG